MSNGDQQSYEEEQEQQLLQGDEYETINSGENTPTNDHPDSLNGGDLNVKEEERKLFVGGLSWETTEKELREYFSKFGEIESVNIKTDTNTGRSRGFSFILFREAEALDRVLEGGDHIINNKKVDPKKAKLRPGKIFVGGITPEMTDEDIMDHFSQFGQITGKEMPFDKARNQRKGFCFLTFESDQIVYEIVRNPKQVIKGKQVDVKKATPKPNDGFLLGRGRGRGRGNVRGVGRGAYPMPGYGAMPDYSMYGYGYDYYGYGAAYGYGDYYSADPYAYGYDYSAYGYDPSAYQQVAAPSHTSTTPQESRGRSKSSTSTSSSSKRGGGSSRGYRHTPY